MKGAVDDLDLLIHTLEESGFSQDRFYIHCDGALFGLMMPFVKRVTSMTFLFLFSFHFSTIDFDFEFLIPAYGLRKVETETIAHFN